MSPREKDLITGLAQSARDDLWPEATEALIEMAGEYPALVSNNLFWLRIRLPRFLQANPGQKNVMLGRLFEAHTLCRSPVLLHIIALLKMQFGEREEGLSLNRQAAVANAGGKIKDGWRDTGGSGDWKGPEFIVLGAQKTATSALYNYLNLHPMVLPAIRKELFYFTDPGLYSYGMPYYASCFPPTVPGESLSGEASATYFNNPLAMHRLLADCPASRLIVTVRNPVDRAISDFYMKVRDGVEERGIEEALSSEMDALSRLGSEELPLVQSGRGYVFKGMYFFPFRHLLEQAGSSRVCLVDASELKLEPARVLGEVCAFLGIPSLPATRLAQLDPVNVGSYDKSGDQSLRERLSMFYQPFNQKFYSLAGVDYGW